MANAPNHITNLPVELQTQIFSMALESAKTFEEYRETASGISDMNALAAMTCIWPRLQWLKRYIATLESRRRDCERRQDFFRRKYGQRDALPPHVSYVFMFGARNLREIATLLKQAEGEKGTLGRCYKLIKSREFDQEDLLRA